MGLGAAGAGVAFFLAPAMERTGGEGWVDCYLLVFMAWPIYTAMERGMSGFKWTEDIEIGMEDLSTDDDEEENELESSEESTEKEDGNMGNWGQPDLQNDDYATVICRVVECLLIMDVVCC
uniref:Uncharacterized protein n=1 Tax=Setaria viridis TaxID=4556 RepID=A0A4U6VJA1_SETVI|nr:hypothetical protein SEVIR_3G416400v2 [Setaria viridis]